MDTRPPREQEALQRKLREALEHARDQGRLPEIAWVDADDLGRLSRESSEHAAHSLPRPTSSAGSLRLTGAAVVGHSASLASVGEISTAWQRAVTAVAASLEGFKGLRGRVKTGITERSMLDLTASPAPGSVLLHLAPHSEPMPEVEPDGQISVTEHPRPLADRAAERFLDLLDRLAQGELGDVSATVMELRDLGPRVAAAVRRLAVVIDSANITLETAWEEPNRPRSHARLTVAEARWVRDFVEGRDLDADDVEVEGKAVTLSSVSKWRVDTQAESLYIDASGLSSAVRRLVSVDDIIRVRAKMTTRKQPDGTERSTYSALNLEVLSSDTLFDAE